MLRILIKEMISDLKTRRTKLNVFDFDGTLFNSPEPPSDWKKPPGTWYYELKSLSKELIGDGSGLWNRQVVSAAMKCLSDDKSITILLTGRNQRNFDEIVKELIANAGLSFDYVKLNPGGNTEKFKINEIKKILELNYRIKTIEFWDDNEEYLQTYKSTFEDLGYNVIINLI